MYLIDAVLRHYKKQGSDLGRKLVARFQQRITDAFSPFRNGSSSLKKKLVKVWEAWKKRSIFDKATLDSIARAGDIFEDRERTSRQSASAQPPQKQVSADDVLGALMMNQGPAPPGPPPPRGGYGQLPTAPPNGGMYGRHPPGPPPALGAPPPAGARASRWGNATGGSTSLGDLPGGAPPTIQTLGHKRPREEKGWDDSVVGKIFFGGLHPDTVESELEKYFTQFGHMSSFYIVKDSATQRHKGYGFATFQDPASLEKCVAQSHTHISHGKPFEVKQAVKRGEALPTRGRMKKPCFSWQRGFCARGDACTYSHDGPKGEGGGPGGTGMRRNPCFNFAKGICKFGDQCRYLHDPAQAPAGGTTAGGMGSNTGYNFRPAAAHKTTGSNGVAMKFVRSFGPSTGPAAPAAAGGATTGAAAPAAGTEVGPGKASPPPVAGTLGTGLPISASALMPPTNGPSRASTSPPGASLKPVSSAASGSAMPSLSKPSLPPPAPLAVEAVPMAVPFRAAAAKKGKGNPFKKRKKMKKKAAAEDLFDL